MGHTSAQQRGLPNIPPNVSKLPHKASRLLEHLSKRGASDPLRTHPWTPEQRTAAIKRGPHKLAHEKREFVSQELLEFCNQGYWIVLPYTDIAHWPSLRLSPLGVVPQRNRRPRLIVDYSFSQVNHDTVNLAPPEAMQFGRDCSSPTQIWACASCKD